MRRKSFDALVSAAGVLLTVILIAAGALAFWGYSYSNNTVTNQLRSQDITFPPAAAFAHAKAGTEITPSMIPSVSQYAGQRLQTGAQAEAYADHFIAVHLSEMPYGGVYAKVSAAAMAAKPGSAEATQLKAVEQTVFQGTSLRGMLLNAYGWWKIGQIALYSAIAAWALAAITLVLSALGAHHFRKVPVDEEIPRLNIDAPPVTRSNGAKPALVGTNS